MFIILKKPMVFKSRGVMQSVSKGKGTEKIQMNQLSVPFII
jgi:hypothetical protein